MTNYIKSICTPALVLLFAASCCGREIPLQNPELKNSTSVAAATAKIVLSEGTDMHGSFRCSLQDKAGNLWFGTTGAGLYRYDGTSFTNYAQKEGLPDAAIYSIAEDHTGKIWLATGSGVYYSEGNAFVRLQNPVTDNDNLHLMNGVVSPENDRLPWAFSVYALISDKKGNIWFGTESFGLWRYALSEKQLTNFQYTEEGWKIIPGDSAKYYARKRSGLIQCIMEDKDGRIWFSAVGYIGLYCYDGKSVIQTNAGVISKCHIFSMLQDKDGNIWCATRDNTICHFNPSSVLNADSGSVAWFGKKEGFLDNACCLLEDKNGNIWTGSVGKLCDPGGRVMRYNEKSFTQFPTETLSSSHIWTMLEDKAGNMWFGTREMGLYRYDGTSFTAFSGTVSGG